MGRQYVPPKDPRTNISRGVKDGLNLIILPFLHSKSMSIFYFKNTLQKIIWKSYFTRHLLWKCCNIMDTRSNVANFCNLCQKKHKYWRYNIVNCLIIVLIFNHTNWRDSNRIIYKYTRTLTSVFINNYYNINILLSINYIGKWCIMCTK
jgi:hypothetical protein